MHHASPVDRLLDFLERSPTPWHAVTNMAERLEAAGYRRLDETQPWTLVAGERIYVTRNDASIIAMQLPKGRLDALRMIGAHTDSPGLHLKPHAAQRIGALAHGRRKFARKLHRGAVLAGGDRCDRIIVDHLQRVRVALAKRGVGSQVHYRPIYHHPYYRKQGFKVGMCPKAEWHAERTLSIPLYPTMTEEQVDTVIKAVLEVCP